MSLPVHTLDFSVIEINGEDYPIEPPLKVVIGKEGQGWMAICEEFDLRVEATSVEEAQVRFEVLIRGFLTGSGLTADNRSTTDGLELRSRLLDRIPSSQSFKLVKGLDNGRSERE